MTQGRHGFAVLDMAQKDFFLVLIFLPAKGAGRAFRDPLTADRPLCATPSPGLDAPRCSYCQLQQHYAAVRSETTL